jgi:hypothetical protein
MGFDPSVEVPMQKVITRCLSNKWKIQRQTDLQVHPFWSFLDAKLTRENTSSPTVLFCFQADSTIPSKRVLKTRIGVGTSG